MKPKSPTLIKFLTVCIAPAIAGLAIQSADAGSATWNGGAATNVLNTAANWTAGGPPTASGDTATWNGTATGALVLTWTPAFGSSPDGTSIDVTAGQTSSLLVGSGYTGTSTNADVFALRNVTIASGAGAFTFGDGVGFDDIVLRSPSPLANVFTNNSSNTATFASNVYYNSGTGNDRTMTYTGSGDWQVSSGQRFSNGPWMSVIKDGAGTLTLSGTAVTSSGNGFTTYTINAGTVKVTGAGLLGGVANLVGTNVLGTSAAITNNGAFSYESSASQIISGIVSGSGTFGQTAGNLTLSAVNTYSGLTTITGGTLNVSGTGSINSSSGITVNGATAKYLHTSSVASTQNIALSQGSVAGTGTISAVTVANGTGQVANGNGNSSVLTINNLTYNGAGGITIADDGDSATSGIVVSGTLATTPISGQVTVNATSSFWNSGVTYNLLSAGSFSGSLTDFTKGTIVGLTSRQNSALVLNGTTLGLFIGGDNPKWTGLDSSNWVAASTGANGNWKLIAGGTATDYIQGDVVLFDDTATNKTVTISAANVSPAVVNFNNSAGNDYTLNGPFGISTGALNKNGTGNATISTANTYSGGTTITAGTLTLSGAGTLGSTSNALTAAGGTVNLGGASQTVGSLTVSGAATLQNGSLTAPGLLATNATGFNATISSNLALGSGTISKSGGGILTLSGTTTYSGLTTISDGVLALSGTGSLGTTSGVTMAGGSLDLGGQSINPGAVNINVAATAADTIGNGTISPTSFTFNSIDGVSIISANIAGNIGVTATRLAGAAFPPPTGTLSLRGENTFTGALNFAGPAAVSIDGGSNTGGGAITFNSPGSSLTLTAGSYLTSGIASSGYSEFRFLNLNGGVLESQGDIFSSTLAISTVISGGTLKCGNPAGITWYDANNQIAINGGGATIDTTIGNITVGLNTGGAAALANPLTRLNGTALGPIILKGGKSLVSGIANNGSLEIQDNSTWNLRGIASSVAGLSGNGSITSSTGPAVLTITTDATFSYSGNFAGAGNISLVKLGFDTQTLTANLTNQGNTTVNVGTLEIAANSATTFSDAATISIVAGAALNLPNSFEDLVASVVINNVPLAPGTYDSASPETSGYITGSGQLKVVAGFANWMSEFTTLSAADRLPSADPDADGIPNLLEYAVDGLSPVISNGSVGSLTGLVVSFTKRPVAVTNGDISYDIEASSDLGAIDPWTIVTDSHVTENSNAISYTFNPGTDGSKDFVRLKVVQN